MRACFRFLTVLLCFSVDVSLKAETSAFLLQPESCLSTESVCAIYAVSKKRNELKLNKNQINFPYEALIVRESNHSIKLVQGYVIVDAQGKMLIKTLFGQFEIEQGKAMIEVDRNQMKVTVIQGMGYLESLNGQEKLRVPAGYSNWLGGVTLKGKVTSGFPRAANFSQVIKLWGEVFLGDPKDFYKEIAKMKPYWVDAVEFISQKIPQEIHREVASLKEKRRLRDLRKKRRAAESKRLEEMFYKRTFNP